MVAVAAAAVVILSGLPGTGALLGKVRYHNRNVSFVMIRTCYA